MKIRYIITAIVYFAIALICFVLYKDTKVVQVKLDFVPHDNDKTVYFIVANPPNYFYNLLNLLSNHLDSFASKDTIEKYRIYYYFRESWFTPRNSEKEMKSYHGRGSFFGPSAYFDEHREDLLMRIIINAEYNYKEITLYRKGKKELEIYLPWKTGRQPASSIETKVIIYDKKWSRTEKEIIYKDGSRKRETVYQDGRREEKILLPGEED